MKTIFSILLIFLFGGSEWLSGQEFPAGIPGIMNKMEPVSSIVGSYPQNIDWYLWSADDWIADKKVTLTYTSWGDPQVEIWDYPEMNDEKIIYSYDGSRNLVSKLEQEKFGDVWLDQYRTIQEFDANGNLILLKEEKSYGEVWVIENAIRNEYEYGEGRVITEISWEFNLSSQAFEPATRSTYLYNNSGWNTEMLVETYTDGIWLNAQRYYLFYENNARLDSMLVDYWVETDWIHFFKVDYVFTDEKSFTYTMFVYNLQTADYDVPLMRVTQNYDQHGNLILSIQESPDAGNWFLNVGSQYLIDYQGDRAIQRITRVWSYAENAWINKWKEVFKNFINLGVEDPMSLTLRLDCYPNPATDFLWINFSAFGSSFPNLELLDLSGHTLKSSSPELPAGHVAWNLSDIPAGFYLVRMTDQMGRVVTRKLIKH